ncbi:MAG: Txe/YoeB family addiction module toxin [Dysgonamonadaceae bacterium]|jgi:toxin YoeB|nr:Txe/YoeB family addiction module toxin [Dysgonamonadaceae bacterium]
MEIKISQWDLILKPKALEDRNFFKKSGNKPLMKKIQHLLEELESHPETGTGKPEKLKENLSGYWSRRITDEHRIVYAVDNEKKQVEIYSLCGHYEK